MPVRSRFQTEDHYGTEVFLKWNPGSYLNPFPRLKYNFLFLNKYHPFCTESSPKTSEMTLSYLCRNPSHWPQPIGRGTSSISYMLAFVITTRFVQPQILAEREILFRYFLKYLACFYLHVGWKWRIAIRELRYFGGFHNFNRRNKIIKHWFTALEDRLVWVFSHLSLGEIKIRYKLMKAWPQS